MNAIRWTFASARAWAVAAAVLAGYAITYLLVAKALVIAGPGAFSGFGPLPALRVASDLRAASWIDPAFVLYVTDRIVLAPSLPTVLVAILIGLLVGVNVAMGVEAAVRPPVACAGAPPLWAVAALPSLLVSFSCCAPTLLVLLGGTAAGALIPAISFLAPLSAILLVVTILWTGHRLERTAVAGQGRTAAPPLLVKT